MALDTAYQIVEWIKHAGEVGAVDRVMLMILPACLDERIDLRSVKPSTCCDPAFLDLLARTAEKVVGHPSATPR